MTKNTIGLVQYLRTVGIDAERVREKGLDETGYDYIRVQADGRPIYGDGNRLSTERVEWPSADVYDTVIQLLNGENIYAVKPVTVDATPPDPEEKAAQEADSKTPEVAAKPAVRAKNSGAAKTPVKKGE